MSIWRTRIACWKTKAKNAHLELVILIAFARQQLLKDGVCLNVTLDCCIELTNAPVALFGPDCSQ
jgi:hypothetical protein